MNVYVQKLLKHNRIAAAFSYALRMDITLRKHHQEAVVCCCVETGNLQDAKRFTEIIGRSLSRSELTTILEACILDGEFAKSMAAAKELGSKMTTKQLKALVGACLSRNNFGDAITAAEMMNKTQKKLVAGSIRHMAAGMGYYPNAVQAAGVQGEVLTQAELKEIADYCLRYDNTLNWAIEATRAMQDQEERENYLEKALTRVITKGYLDTAKELAKDLGRSLTNTELEYIIAVCHEYRQLDTIKEALKLLSPKDASWALNKAIDRRLEKLEQGDQFEQIIQLVYLLPMKLQTKRFKSLLASFIAEGSTIKALRVVKALNRQFTSDECVALMEACLDKDKIADAAEAASYFGFTAE